MIAAATKMRPCAIGLCAEYSAIFRTVLHSHPFQQRHCATLKQHAARSPCPRNRQRPPMRQHYRLLWNPSQSDRIQDYERDAHNTQGRLGLEGYEHQTVTRSAPAHLARAGAQEVSQACEFAPPL